MTYRERVQALCDQLHLQNPIQEKFLTIKEIQFYCEGERDARLIEATDMNRAGRLFFQAHVGQANSPTTIVRQPGVERLQRLGQEFFGSLWDDAEEKKRTLIAALKAAHTIEVFWKPRS